LDGGAPLPHAARAVLLLRHPAAARLLATSIVARIPLAAMSVVLIVHAHALTGSYAIAGLVAGVNGIALAVLAPLLGRMVDDRGQGPVLLGAAAVSGAALAAAALLPHDAPAAALVALAAIAGATPPLGACLRTLWPAVFDDPADVQAAFALESAVLELTYISGPLVFLTLGTIVSTRVALAGMAALLVAGTIVFAAQPASRAWRPDHAASTGRALALRSPGVLTLVIVTTLFGMLLGAVEVAVPAAASAADATGATGPLLAVWGAGSLVGGVAAAQLGGVGGARAVVVLLALLGVGHAVLAAGESLLVLGGLLMIAGLGIAPLFAASYGLVGGLALPGTATEAFAWMSTAIAGGAAAGAAVAGPLVDAGGPAPAFVAAGLAAVAAAAVAAARAPSLRGAPVAA
jgi:MFS family permease